MSKDRGEILRDDMLAETWPAMRAVTAALQQLVAEEAVTLAIMGAAYQRLIDEHGWGSPCTAPNDGTVFDAIEVDSVRIHDCVYRGEWPNGQFFFKGADAPAGDFSILANPVLIRPRKTDAQP